MKDGGHFGFIIENYWLENDWADKLRKYILEHSKIRLIVHFGSIKIFSEAGNDTCLLILQKEANEKSKKKHKVKVVRAKKVKRNNRELLDHISNHIQEQRYSDEFIDVFWVNQSNLSSNKWVLSKEEELLDRLKIGRKNIVTLGDTEVDGKKVRDICNIGKGQESHKNEVFVVDKESIETKNFEKNLLKPVVKSGDINRYSIKFQDRYLILTLNETKIENYPNVLKYLKNSREKLEDRHRVKENIRKWYAIGVPQNLDLFEADEKTLVPYRAKRASFAYDDRGYFNDGGDVRGIACEPNCKLDLKYILGLLNSKLLTFWYRIAGKKGGMLEFFTTPLSRIPIRNIDFSNKEEKRKHDKIVKLVEDIQVLKKQERWISETFENLLKNYDMTEEEPLSYFFDPKDRSKLEKFGINVAETRKMDRGEAGVIDEYKVDLEGDSVLISVRYKDKSNYREVLDLHFEDAALKEFFFLALKRNEGDKNYRSEKPVFETTMGDMTVPKSSETDLIDENVEAFQTLMEVLRKEFEKKVSKKWENSSVKKLDLTRIERAIEETDRDIDRVVYDLYGLTEEEVETVESHV
ncbi:hypothetical protein AKJ44_02080 [candidate division MSBL1 archaeon SCGC-AAA261F17]|uniref:site-specific DNA-methyltransferase (adenine-specific) n=1 Tax=candidate division MSBL1 archaeon SCGC-AAA261F17 TaxID=1698274 RepID=A0A133V5X5_9EURY|nr:hypothetical protein AKJ44_02080 [candidate division MSBL1 archaeon SCGC-AAA261F17]